MKDQNPQEKSVVVRKIKRLPAQNQSPQSLIALAIEKGTPLETIEKLMDLQDRWDAKQSKISFDNDMAKFQGSCPVIEKRKQGNNYKYAPLDDIVSQVRELLKDHGFSYRIEAVMDNDMVTATCLAIHRDGHSEKSSFSAKIEKVVSKTGSSVRTAMQDAAASLTFAKRYAFCNAFGIMTGDEDVDGSKNSSNRGGEKFVNYVDKLVHALKHNGAKDIVTGIEVYNRLTGENITEFPKTNESAKDCYDLLTNSPLYVS